MKRRLGCFIQEKRSLGYDQDMNGSPGRGKKPSALGKEVGINKADLGHVRSVQYLQFPHRRLKQTGQPRLVAIHS